MTISLTPRRTAVLIIAALAFIVAYLLGSAHSGGSVAAAASTGAASPGGTGTATGITVSSTGKVTGKPDTLQLDLSVQVNGSTVSAALAAANAAEAKVLKALRASGVTDADLQTSGLSIQPNYTYEKSGQPTLHGYQVTESVTAKIRDLGKAGDVIGSAVAAGGNAVRVNGISLDLEDTGALVSAAREHAFADAKTKAEQYAKAAGRSLGAVVSVSEDAQAPSPVRYDIATAGAAFSSAALAPEIAAGSQDVNVTVTVVFAFA
jgi:uncharacterized protein YggE